jgi:hypothetical protein
LRSALRVSSSEATPRFSLALLDVVPSTGGSVRELDSGGSDPSFSADGRFLAFRQGVNPLFVTTVGFVALNGGPMVSLGAGDAPSWSPTGHRLAFQVATFGNSAPRGITVVDVTRPSHRWTVASRNAGAPLVVATRRPDRVLPWRFAPGDLGRAAGPDVVRRGSSISVSTLQSSGRRTRVGLR